MNVPETDVLKPRTPQMLNPSSGEGRLLVVSNRAPVRVVREGGLRRIETTVGGLGSTFMRLLGQRGGTWIAWSGVREDLGRLTIPAAARTFSMAFVRLTERDVSNYYYGMCNRALWPLMHFMSLNCHFDAAQWDSYRRVNRLFAKTAEAEVQPSDAVWIQDFHLALVPGLLRRHRSTAPIGIFWHVPWPPEQLFRIFPWRNELLTGMLGSDLIGFHIPSYAKHFLDGCERILGYQVNREAGTVIHPMGSTQVGVFPLGIDNHYFHELSTSERVKAKARRIRKMVRTPTVVLSVDRLDYTKGIPQRLQGFERFLELNPAYRGRVTLIQIAVPSRSRVAEYAMLKRQVDELVGRIVGRFSSGAWVPIRYLYTQFPTDELAAYYQAADVALVTPLRDGMNLVAKEFLVANTLDASVLILSEFAGAAQELKSAVLVNPYDVDQIARGLRNAVEMPVEERRARLSKLRASVEHNSLDVWSENYLSAMTSASKLNGFRLATN